MTTEPVAAEAGRDFIRDIVQADLASRKHSLIVTRFPPEPNGYLHIGHAKSIALNFGIAQEFGGRCHLRFDDTNPTKEEQEYIDSIQADVRWLGFDWGENLFFASDYFERLYDWAEGLIKAGLAYVDDQSQEEIRVNRGTLTEPGKNSPFRERAGRRKPRPVPPHEGRRIPERRARAAGQDRHGRRQHQPARSRALSHPACASSAHRRQLVHLSELRLRPWPVGRHRGHHAFDLHAGIRGSPAALRVASRQAAGAVKAAAVRIRAAQPDLHAAVQARADPARARRPCRGLGRSAHADRRRAEAPRRAAGGDPRIRQAHWRCQSQQRRRCRHAGVLHPRASQQVRRCAAWRCCGRSRS